MKKHDWDNAADLYKHLYVFYPSQSNIRKHVLARENQVVQ